MLRGLQIPGVQNVSDLHVWSLKPGIPLLAAHLCLKEGADGEVALSAATSYCRSAGIECARPPTCHSWGADHNIAVQAPRRQWEYPRSRILYHLLIMYMSITPFTP